MAIQHVSEFSPDGKLFASINAHGILNIWDTETNELKQEYTPNLHLASPCTSFTWILASTQKRKKGKKKSSEGVAEQLYLAFGTNKGGVSLYSFSSGKIERNFQGEGHSAHITGIAYDKKSTIFTCGDDCQVVVWSIAEEKQVASWSTGNEKPHSIAYLSESNSVLVGARQLKQYSLESHDLIQTFTGHTSEIILLKTFVHNFEEYAVSASKLDRVLSLWTIKKGSKYKNALSTFLMEDIANSVSCKLDNYDEFKVAAVTRSAVIHFYVKGFDLLKPDKPIKPKVTIEIASDASSVVEPIPAATVSLDFPSEEKDILFAYGQRNVLFFEHVAPNFAEQRQILIRNDPKKLLSKSGEKNKENNLKHVTPIISTNDVEYQIGIAPIRKHNKTIEIPMQTRLENLSLAKGETQQQSKVQLLVQALHSKDANFLKLVLGTNDPKVIQLTVQRLPIQYIASFVDELTSLMQKKKINVQIASNWMKVLVRTHTSQLMALGPNELLNKFGTCLGILEHRMNCLKDLSKLSGRLELLVSQIQRNNEVDEIFNNENLLVYEDADSSNSDLEDQGMQSHSSDDAWSEAESDEEMDEEMDVSDKEN